jgi:hypothetical protein
MNIFVLDEHPELAARYHTDRHVSKQILETAQMLCTAHVLLDGDPIAQNTLNGMVLRLPTHTHHPCAVWARTAGLNYDWLHQLGEALLYEYAQRFGKEHGFVPLFNELRKKPLTIEYLAMRTPWVQHIPEIYKSKDAVESYRQFYYHEKRNLAVWSPPSSTPWWWNAGNVREKYHV